MVDAGEGAVVPQMLPTEEHRPGVAAQLLRYNVNRVQSTVPQKSDMCYLQSQEIEAGRSQV